MVYAALDIGGTFIKHSVTDDRGEPLPGSVSQTPIDSSADRGRVLAAMDAAIAALRAFAPELTRAAVSIPGPFDYDAGVSHMKHKFQAIEGVSLKDFFLSRGLQAEFLHDSTAFMLGEGYLGAACGAQTAFGVMLGTGLGFAMMQNGLVLVNDAQRPALSLWNAPFRSGIAEDFISRRALRAQYARLTDISPDAIDVREICDHARLGDPDALAVLRDLSVHLSQILAPLVHRFSADRLVIGGQIARSHDLFLPDIQSSLGIPVLPARHLDDAALRGAAIYAARGRASCVRVAGFEG